MNKADPEVRQRFTIAHELGHLLLHRKELESNPSITVLFRRPIGDTNTNTLEKETNTFASQLLLPEEWLEIYDQESIDRIARLFNVSRDVVGYRLAYRTRPRYQRK